MIYREITPHPKLRKQVKCFWMLDHDYSRSSHDHEQLWADAHTELIFTSGHRYLQRKPGPSVTLPASFVIGPFQNELQLFSRGRTALVAARFWPWGFHPFSKLPMTDLKNSICSCRRTFVGAGRRIELELSRKPDLDTKIRVLEDALLNALTTMTEPKLRSRPAAAEILKTHGMIRITELLQKHDTQARQLERIFLEEIGVTAKVLSRIVRFNHARRMIEKNPDIDLLSLTYECGYSDQPHFTRNFREMFGITPAEFKSRMKSAFKRLAEERPDVVFVQDTVADTG